MSAAPKRNSRPLTAVLDALDMGAGSLEEVARRTGLPRDVVGGAVDHLVRLGRLSTERLDTGCPEGGCGGCALAQTDAPGCDTGRQPTSHRGPVLVALTRRR